MDVPGMTGYFIEKLSREIGEDRIIPIDDMEHGRFAYIDTEDCSVYLVTVQEAHFTPASSQDTSGEDR